MAEIIAICIIGFSGLIVGYKPVKKVVDNYNSTRSIASQNQAQTELVENRANCLQGEAMNLYISQISLTGALEYNPNPNLYTHEEWKSAVEKVYSRSYLPGPGD
jgi:hypothetical protein